MEAGAAHTQAGGGRRPRLAELAFLGPMLIAAAVVCVGFWPGHMSADTLTQIAQVSDRTPITDHHAPILVWLWSLVWPLGLGPGFVLVLQVAAFLVGAYLVARAAFGRMGASLVATALTLSPLAIGMVGYLSRDTWFIALLLLAFGLAIRLTRTTGRDRTVTAVAALVAAFLCLAARQNAAPAVVIAVIAVAALLLAPRLAGASRLKRLGLPLAAGVAATVAMLGLQVGSLRAFGVESARPEQYVYFYDLAALSVDEGRSLFPESVYPSGDVAVLAQTSSLDSIIPLGFGEDPPISMPRPPEQIDEMRDAWVDTVTDDPIDYLQMRTESWLHQISVSQVPIFIYHPGIDANDQGFEVAFPDENEVVTDYQELFADEFLNGYVFHRVWIYLLIAAVAAVLLLRRRTAPLLIVGGAALAAWTYQFGLFFGAMGTQYRLEYPAVVLAILAAAVLVKALLDERRKGRYHHTVDSTPSSSSTGVV